MSIRNFESGVWLPRFGLPGIDNLQGMNSGDNKPRIGSLTGIVFKSSG